MSQTVTMSRILPLPAIKANGQGVELRPVASPAEIPAGTRAHIITAVDPLDADRIAAMPDSLGLIASFGVGTDHIDLTAAAARGITVSNTPVVTEDTADLAFALILAAARRTGQAERFLRAGQWTSHAVAPSPGIRVHGAALGLVGFGPIAQAVARRARGFGMAIRYWNRSRRTQAEADLGAEYVADLDDLLGQSDIVSVHTALVPATRNLIDAARLLAMRQGAVLINTARGGLVDEAALCDALDRGHLGAAGLDVFDGEPALNPALLQRDDIVLTPHIGSATSACRADMARTVLRNVVAYLETGTVPDAVSAN
ncbi:NAD(P)-dependent oxidoreductase [Paracoccus sp. (in: a-proteobacteria)]|jgi:glyoxylate reductase|uniref:NAD(P)-dependent oxidoreductase n=1 Tax=Paracoccus sp. TaxID=267 RepID=UPI0035ADBCC4